jgi:PAS domain S-box-containing protein
MAVRVDTGSGQICETTVLFVILSANRSFSAGVPGVRFYTVSTTPMSLSLRFGFLTIGLLIAAVLTISYLFDRERIAAAETNKRETVRLHAERAADALVHYTERLRSDTLFLADLPPVKAPNRIPSNDQRGFSRGRNSPDYSQIAQLFLALAQARPEYFQLRLIGADEEAHELVRIERRGNKLIEVDAAALQPKGAHYYVKDALQLQPGQVQLSRIDLNREQDRISLPETPTLRATTPVMDTRQRVIALVVVNLDMGWVFKRMSHYLPASGQLFLVNPDGYFLHHSDPSRAMAFERQEDYRLQDEFPHDAPAIRRLTTDAELAFKVGSDYRAALAYATTRSLATSPGRNLPLTLIVTEPGFDAFREIAAARQDSYIVIALLIILASTLALFVGHRMTRSLRGLVEVSHAVSLGQFEVGFPRSPRGELGNLSNAFEQMVLTLKGREGQLKLLNRTLEDEVKKRTRELKGYQAKLEREQMMFQSILDHVGDGVVAVDGQGRFLLWNHRAEELLGTGAADIAPADWPSHYGLYRAPNDTLLELEELPLMRALQGETVRNQDLYIRHNRQATGRWISVIARPLGNPEQEIFGAVAVLVDIEEARRLKEHREMQAGELEKIGRLTLIAQIVDTVTHRLSQPLAAIANYTGAALLLRASDKLDNKRLEEILNHIARLAERGGDNLEELRRLTSKTRLPWKPLDVNEIIQTARQLLEDRLVRLNIATEQRLTPDPPPVMGQEGKLQEALIYLLINALEALSPIKGQPRRLYLVSGCSDDRSRVRIAVGDNGPGIEPQLNETIFEPWFTTKPDALGLGLTVARSVVENHNGTIGLQPRDDRLTWFVIELPAINEQ